MQGFTCVPSPLLTTCPADSALCGQARHADLGGVQPVANAAQGKGRLMAPARRSWSVYDNQWGRRTAQVEVLLCASVLGKLDVR